MSVIKPTNIKELIAHCKTRLGEPVINIDVAEDQCVIRAHEALYKFVTFHFEATETAWLTHKITHNTKAKKGFKVPDYVENVIEVMGIDGSLFNGIIPDGYALPINQMSLTFANFYDVIGLHLYDLNRSYYKNILNPPEVFRFVKATRNITIDVNEKDVLVGNYIVYKASVDLTKVEGSEIWSNPWLTKYTSALIKLQWGENLGKYREITLPGGHTLNSDQIKADAKEEIEKLEQELQDSYTAVLPMIIG